MSQDSKGLHWPSLFMFLIAAALMVSAIYYQTLSSFLSALGFACFGYSSIRILPSNLFTQKLSLFGQITSGVNYRKIDAVIQLVGFAFLVASLVVSNAFYT